MLSWQKFDILPTAYSCQSLEEVESAEKKLTDILSEEEIDSKARRGGESEKRSKVALWAPHT